MKKIKLYKIGRPGLFAFDEKDGDIYTTNWINGVSTLTKYNEETGKIQRYEESVGMFGYLHCAGNYVYVEKQVDQEEGTITTPFDMRVQNEIDRFHLVKNVIKYLPQLGNRGSYLVQQMNDKLVEHKQYIHEYGQDLPEVRDWKWNL